MDKEFVQEILKVQSAHFSPCFGCGKVAKVTASGGGTPHQFIFSREEDAGHMFCNPCIKSKIPDKIATGKRKPHQAGLQQEGIWREQGFDYRQEVHGGRVEKLVTRYQPHEAFGFVIDLRKSREPIPKPA